MSIGLVFWILMLLWFVFWLAGHWGAHTYGPLGNNVFLFVLFLLLGWQLFGAPIQGSSGRRGMLDWLPMLAV